jgi:hypothetical protein
MTPLDRIARAALDGDALAAREHLLEWMSTAPRVADVPAPAAETDPAARALSAALAELFASRWGQPPPDWAAEIGPAPSPTHLVRATARMPWFRAQFESEAPLPLKRRLFYAPANYLQLV